MKKIIAIILLLPALCQAQHETTAPRGISRAAADARYVLRNPYYDGSQSVTVASASVNGAMDVNGILRIASPYYLKSDELVSYTGGATGITIPSVVKVLNGSFSVGTSTLVVTGGKVGVGTASPVVTDQSALTSEKTFAGITYPLIAMNKTAAAADTGSGIGFWGGTGPSQLAQVQGVWEGTATTEAGMRLLTRAGGTVAEKMRITSAGNVGIGTTAPDQKLTVAGNISLTGNVISSGTGSNYFAGLIRHTTTGSYLDNNSVCAAGSGNVPVCMFGGGSNGSISSRLTNHPLLLGTFNNTDILTLGIAGSVTGANFKGPVGISSTTPAAQLGVTGGIIATGQIVAQSSMTVGVSTQSGQFVIGNALGQSITGYSIKISSANGDHTFGVHNDGHLSIGGYSPSLGTCANATITGHDGASFIAFSGANTTCDVTFGRPFDATPICTLGTQSTTVTMVAKFTTKTTTGYTIVPNAGAWANGDNINVICLGQHE